MRKFNTYSADEKRTRKANHKNMKQTRKLSTEIKEIRNENFLSTLLSKKKSEAC